MILLQQRLDKEVVESVIISFYFYCNKSWFGVFTQKTVNSNIDLII